MKKIINILFNKAKSFIRIVRIELDLRFGIPYNYFGKKIFASKQKYLEIFEVAKNEKFKNIDLFEESNSYKIDRNWLDTLALHTQVLIKSSKINYQHGRVLYTSLCKYLKDNDDITILETGTARGFSALCMSKALSDYKKNGRIIKTSCSEGDALWVGSFTEHSFYGNGSLAKISDGQNLNYLEKFDIGNLYNLPFTLKRARKDKVNWGYDN